MFDRIDKESSKSKYKEKNIKELNGFSIDGAISELRSLTSNRLAKYRRNYRRYNYTPYANIESFRCPSLVGYWQLDENDENTDVKQTPQINVIKSCIDTLNSKIAQSKVRPYFNSFNGTYKDIKIVKQCQHFFDLYFDQQNVNKTVSDAFRDGCIFDTGWVYVDVDLNRIIKLLPFQVYFRPAEMNYGQLTRVYIEFKEYPVTLLPQEIYDRAQNHISNREYITYGIYYDIIHHVKAYRVGFSSIDETTKETKESYLSPFVFEYSPAVVPLVYLHYNTPVLGCYSQSVVDMLNSIQLQIDALNAKISEASQLNPAQTFFVPEGSNIKAQQLNNRIGNVIEYRSEPGSSGVPVIASTPGFIDPSYFQERDSLIEQAYSMVGISQLSAQSKKPRGLDAAKALLTMEDVESERFETQLNQVIRAYIDLAKVCIACFDEDDYILPPDKYRSSLKWGDIRKASALMNIQFTGADSLSKDPSTKLQQLQALAQAGAIPQTMIARYMEVPDLESGYSMATNANDAVDSVIENCIENDDYDIPDYIPFTMLKEQIINMQLLLRSTNYQKNKKDIEKLSILYSKAEELEENWKQTLTDEQIANQSSQNAQGEMGVSMGNVLEQEANMVRAGTPNSQSAPDSVPELPQQPTSPRATGWDNPQI